MSQHHRTSPRAEYRQQENLRINAAPNLAEKFCELKSLTVDLEYYDAGGVRRTSALKYRVNLANAKSAFSFACPNNECVGGDFDLSEKLASTVNAHLATATGEMCCQGWQSKTAIDSTRCHSVLRYKLTLEY
jgi:hypothetical protein